MWILIIIALGGYNATSPAVDHVEFASKDACEAAASALERNAPTSAWSNRLGVRVGCFQK